MTLKVRSILLAAALSAATVLGGPAAQAAPTGSTAQAVPAKEPVILVHGWTGRGADLVLMRDAFVAAGHQAYWIQLPGQNNVTNGHAIAELVSTVRAQTGAPKVSLVGHSMGGLSARYYVKRLGGTATVRSYVSMGTSQYGYLPACLLGEEDGGQMCPSSEFLRDLNAGDDTPGTVSYTTIRSSKDAPNITRLDGGACFHEIPGVPHAEEYKSPPFIQAAITAVGGTCPGSRVDLPIQ